MAESLEMGCRIERHHWNYSIRALEQRRFGLSALYDDSQEEVAEVDMVPHRVLKIDMSDVYQRFPELKLVEVNGQHRLSARRHVLNLGSPGKVGAEIGVFTGMFSEVLEHDLAPKKLYLVDPWAALHGDRFPNWGKYTANISLETAAARDAAFFRVRRFQSDCEIFEGHFKDWISGFKEPFLDWAYVDAAHDYEFVFDALHLIDAKLNNGGIIFGDDCWIKPDQSKSNVFYAVRDFTRSKNYQVLRMDGHGQWAINRISEDKPVKPYTGSTK